jgi:hypothetical protein
MLFVHIYTLNSILHLNIITQNLKIIIYFVMIYIITKEK